MARNNIIMQGPCTYVDIHDNEVVNLSVDKGMVHLEDQPVTEEDVLFEDREENTMEEELNYFAPKKNIAVFLCQDWFDEVSADKKKYTKVWRESLMEALMNSEFKDDIAEEWIDEGKRIQLKCEIAGALILAGVLKGSYSKVASMLDLGGVKYESLAKYMGYAKKQAYMDWIKDFVRS